MARLQQNNSGVFTSETGGIASGWEHWVMLSSDHHHDNPMTDRKSLRAHLEKAKERNADIYIFGDLFCAMQGKYDRRSSMDDIRPEDVGQNYLDLIVTHAADFYAPYAKNIKLVSLGNHESSIVNRHGTNLLSALAYKMNSDHGGEIEVGGYAGWVRFLFTINTTVRQQVRLRFHHGAGGGGPVTKGVIQTNRQAVYLPDADVVVNGHTHDGWVLPIARERLSLHGNPKRDLVWFVRTPSYKDEYFGKNSGFHHETWKSPRPIGCVWLRFYYHDSSVQFELVQDMN